MVGVGASAGGLEAFSAVLESLPTGTGLSFVFVSHLDPKHESILTSLLARLTRMPVLEATHGMVLEPDHVYVIPRNARMTVDKCVLSISRRLRAPAENLPIDHFMKSLARDRKHRAIGVILSGTASDGTTGLTAIKSAGGTTLAQDPGTARYDGMPRSAIRAGVVDFILPPAGIAAMLARIATSPQSVVAAALHLQTPGPQEGGLEEIFGLLRERTGADFSTYKEATVQRRLRHRMALERIRNLADYAGFLRQNPAEADALYEDLLIKVTEFFRDRKTFEHLKTRIIPSLWRKKPPKEPFRVWVPGCSTGEEAYSIAILLFEVAARLRVNNPIQVFATDLSERAIATARKGIYPASIAGSVSPARLRRFFIRSGHEYRIVQRLREACVFARQDITKDPPFSKVDLVSCRNVLIYMGRGLQDTILPILHYALKPDGCPLLGKAETLESYADLFSPVDRKHRIYRRKPGPVIAPTGYPARRTRSAPRLEAQAAGRKLPAVRTEVSLREQANRLIVERFAPTGVVINGKMEILEILGDIHPYVQLTPGTANLSLLRLVKSDLVAQLSAAIDLAKRTGAPVRREGKSVQRDQDGPAGPYLEIHPMTAGPGLDHPLLVLFEAALPPSVDATQRGRARGAAVKEGRGGNARELIRLKHALADNQQHLRLLMDVRQIGIPPIWWTLSERRIRCPG